ncbi:nuclear transport factor 2 family protein [Devosia sp. A369]
MTHPELIDRFYAAYNAHDAEQAASLYAGDGSHTEAASGRSRTGPDALVAGLTGFFKMLEGLRFDVEKQVEAGDHIVVFYAMRGTMTRAIGPFAANAREVTLQGVHRFVIRNGLIHETHDYWNWDIFAAQLQA